MSASRSDRSSRAGFAPSGPDPIGSAVGPRLQPSAGPLEVHLPPPDHVHSHDHVDSSVQAMFGRDTAYLLVSGLQMVCAVLVTPVITRMVGPGSYGNIALGIAISQVVGPILTFGTGTGVQKEFARSGTDTTARNVLGAVMVCSLGLSLVLVGAMSVGSSSLGGSTAVTVYRFAALWGGLSAGTSVALSLLRSKERIRTFAVVSLVQSIGAQLSGLLLVILVDRGPVAYMAGMVVGQGLAFLLAVVATRPRVSGVLDADTLRRVLPYSLPLIPQQLSGFILMAGDRFVVQNDLGTTAVGRYSVAYAVGSLAMALLTVVNQSWLPRVFGLSGGSMRRAVLERARISLDLLLAPLVLGLAVGAPIGLHVWAPSAYRPGQLLSVTVVVVITTIPSADFISNLWLLLSAERTTRLAVATGLAAVANIALNVALIPYIGILGSAWATFIGYGLLAWLTLMFTKPELRLPRRKPKQTALRVGVVALSLASVTVAQTGTAAFAARLVVGVLLAVATVAVLRSLATGRVHSLSLRTIDFLAR